MVNIDAVQDALYAFPAGLTPNNTRWSNLSSDNKNVRDIRDGIMGAMMSVTLFNGLRGTDATVPAYLPSAVVGNLTAALAAIDETTGVYVPLLFCARRCIDALWLQSWHRHCCDTWWGTTAAAERQSIRDDALIGM